MQGGDSDEAGTADAAPEGCRFICRITPGWPEAVVFDLDGTLVDTAPDLAASLNMLLEGQGLEPLGVEEVQTMIGAGVPKLIERGFRARGVSLDADALAPLVETFLTHYSAHATDQSALYPWAEEALKYLTRHAIASGVCTNKPTEVSRRILQDLGLLAYLDADVGGTSGYPKKPDPAPLRALLDQLGVTPKTAVMVGDSATDIATARAAGLPVIVLTHGYSPEPVSELGADEVIDALSDLPQALSRLRARVEPS